MEIKRSVFNDLARDFDDPNVLILLGARQVGKSTLMSQLKKEAEKLSRPILNFNLEFPDDLLFFSSSDKDLFYKLTAQPNSVIFIDEFHYLKNASKLFKAIYDTKKNIKIIASGSSSLEIHKHLKESLAGRRKIVEIFPLSLEEFNQTGDTIENYLIFGGLPGLIHIKSRQAKIEYLSQMVQTYILKDIKGLIKEENIRAFNHLLFYLAEHQGNILPVSNMASEIGVTQNTVNHYLEILEQTFIVYGVHSYSSKLANELKKSQKYFFYDSGISNSFIKNFSPLSLREDLGCIYESLVFRELKKKQTSNVDLRFWRTKNGDEVDFVWIEDRVAHPIEVKTTTTNDRPPRGLLKFLKTYPKAKMGQIFNLTRSEIISIDNFVIHYRQFSDLVRGIIKKDIMND